MKAADLLLAACLALCVTPAVAQGVGCPERPACKGCGCMGGPGYRGPPGYRNARGGCLSFDDLQSVCGVHPDDIGAPSATCRFENLPNTGKNRWCAFGKADPPGFRAFNE